VKKYELFFVFLVHLWFKGGLMKALCNSVVK